MLLSPDLDNGRDPLLRGGQVCLLPHLEQGLSLQDTGQFGGLQSKCVLYTGSPGLTVYCTLAHLDWLAPVELLNELSWNGSSHLESGEL